MKYKTTILVIVSICLSSVLGQSVLALTCIVPSIEDDMAWYPIVFVGEITAIDAPDQNEDFQNEVIHFDVSEVFKGDVTENYTIYGSMWGTGFVMGETYLVFAHIGELGPAYGDCSSTTDLSKLNRSLTDLGESYAPLPGQSSVYGEGQSKVRGAVVMILGASVGIGTVWFVRGRNKSNKETHFDKIAGL